MPPFGKAHGISVFTLSDTASDKEAELKARNENKADLIGGPDLPQDPEAADELRMSARVDEPVDLRRVHPGISSTSGTNAHRLPIAGKGSDMPSVLSRWGSSPIADEANLRRPDCRAKLSKGWRSQRLFRNTTTKMMAMR